MREAKSVETRVGARFTPSPELAPITEAEVVVLSEDLGRDRPSSPSRQPTRGDLEDPVRAGFGAKSKVGGVNEQSDILGLSDASLRLFERCRMSGCAAGGRHGSEHPNGIPAGPFDPLV